MAFVETPGAFQRCFLCLIPSEVREWAPLLVECGEVCQHYFSIFEIADYMDCAGNTVLLRPLKRARQRLCPPKKQGTRELPREFPLYFFLTF